MQIENGFTFQHGICGDETCIGRLDGKYDEAMVPGNFLSPGVRTVVIFALQTKHTRGLEILTNESLLISENSVQRTCVRYNNGVGKVQR